MEGVNQLARQLERSSLYAHTALGESLAKMADTQVLLHALADVLIASGVVAEETLRASMEAVREELQSRGELRGPGLVVQADAETDAARAEAIVDCDARLPVCKAVCCKLDFALAVDEIEAGHAKWDLGRPYFIRHEQDGCCSHRPEGAAGCDIYADRPRVCRRYSCEHDERIWKNFERMELNTEWIQAHLGRDTRPLALYTRMDRPRTPVVPR